MVRTRFQGITSIVFWSLLLGSVLVQAAVASQALSQSATKTAATKAQTAAAGTSSTQSAAAAAALRSSSRVAAVQPSALSSSSSSSRSAALAAVAASIRAAHQVPISSSSSLHLSEDVKAKLQKLVLDAEINDGDPAAAVQGTAIQWATEEADQDPAAAAAPTTVAAAEYSKSSGSAAAAAAAAVAEEDDGSEWLPEYLDDAAGAAGADVTAAAAVADNGATPVAAAEGYVEVAAIDDVVADRDDTEAGPESETADVDDAAAADTAESEDEEEINIEKEEIVDLEAEATDLPEEEPQPAAAPVRAAAAATAAAATYSHARLRGSAAATAHAAPKPVMSPAPTPAPAPSSPHPNSAPKAPAPTLALAHQKGKGLTAQLQKVLAHEIKKEVKKTYKHPGPGSSSTKSSFKAKTVPMKGTSNQQQQHHSSSHHKTPAKAHKGVVLNHTALKKAAHALGVPPRVVKNQAQAAIERHKQVVKLAEQQREQVAAIKRQQQQQQQQQEEQEEEAKAAVPTEDPPSKPAEQQQQQQQGQEQQQQQQPGLDMDIGAYPGPEQSPCFRPLLQPPFFNRTDATSLNNAYIAMLLARYTYPTAFGINVNTNSSRLTYQELFRRKWMALGAKANTIRFQDAGGGPGSKLRKLINAGKPEAHAIVLGTETDVWIGFRGLTSVDSALTSDLKHTPVDAAFGNKKVAVHSGFYNGFRAIWPQVVMAVKAAITQTEDPTEAKIYITGHSLGGAHALFTGLKLAEMKLKNIGGVYIFGTPLFGGSEFLDLFTHSGLEPITTHWWNELDVVPSLGASGPWKRSRYESLPLSTLHRIWGGQCKRATKATSQACPLGPHRCRKSINDHRAFSYVAKLQACVLQQPDIEQNSCMSSKVMSSM